MAIKAIYIKQHPIVVAHTGQDGTINDDRPNRTDPDNLIPFDHYAELGDVVTLEVAGSKPDEDSRIPVEDGDVQWQRIEGVENEKGVYELVFVDIEGETGLQLEITVDEDIFETPYRCVVLGNPSNSISFKRDVANGPTFFLEPGDIKAVPGQEIIVIAGVSKNTGGRYHSYITDANAINGPGDDPTKPLNLTGRITSGNSYIGTGYLARKTVVTADQIGRNIGLEVHDQYGSTSADINVIEEDGTRELTVAQRQDGARVYGYVFNGNPDTLQFGNINPRNFPSADGKADWISQLQVNLGNFNVSLISENLAPLAGLGDSVQLEIEETGETVVLPWDGKQYLGNDETFTNAIVAAVGTTIQINFS